MAPDGDRKALLLAAAAMLSGSALVAISDSLLKMSLLNASSLGMLGLRSVFILILVACLAAWIGPRTILRTSHRVLHALRVLLGVAGTFSFFESLRYLPLATAVILSFLSPLIMSALAPLLVGERLRAPAIFGTLIGFCGAAIVIWRPADDDISLLGVAYGLASSFFLALSWLIVRKIGGRDHVLSFLLFLNIGTLVAGLAATIPFGVLPSVDLTVAASIMAALVLGGNLLMVKAYMLAPVAMVAPLTYSQLLWSVILQILIWNEPPTPRTMTGAAFIVAAGLIATLLPHSRAQP